MRRTALRVAGALALLAALGGRAPAQFRYVGPGSTVQGDYLRGVGVAAFGLGAYNLATAQADAINVNTYMNWNEYIYNVAKNENRENARHRAAVREKNRESYEKILKRILENPEDRDVTSGDALNAVMAQLLDPRISPSTLRTAPVPLSGDTVRRIPFFYGPANATFSMRRLSAKGHWPVGLRGPALARERRAYEDALDAALEQQLEGKLVRESILKVEDALNDLRAKLDWVVPPSQDKVYLEAKNYLDRLQTSKELLKLRAIEQMVGEIDKYSGSTVHDLLVFMDKYKLRFGVPDLGDERRLYPELYAALVQQRALVADPGAARPQAGAPADPDDRPGFDPGNRPRVRRPD